MQANWCVAPRSCYTPLQRTPGVNTINAPATLDGSVAPIVAATEPPLRIALLGYRSAPFSGGQGIYLHYLSRALTKLGHTVTVISGPPYPHLVPEVTLEQLPSLDLYANGLGSVPLSRLLTDSLARVEWLSKLTGGFAEPWTFAERARRWLLPRLEQFDVIHDNQTLADGLLAIQSAGVPLITTIHHPISRDRRLALQAEPRWYRRLLVARWHDFVTMQSRVARQLNHVVTVSSASRRDIVSDFGVHPERVRVVHIGVDATLFRPLPQIERAACQIMATASADTPNKGLSVLLRAAHQLLPVLPNLKLLLVGKPRPGGSTEALVAELGLGDRIEWVHNVDHETIVEHYARSTVAVVPSLYEGFGLPAVEAMACAIPLVVSDGGALPEVVGDAAEVVPAGDHGALAAILQRLLHDKSQRDALGAKARLRAERHFSWDVCAARMVAYYRECMAAC